MQQVTDILPAGRVSSDRISDVFAADYEGRHRRRMVLTLKSGETVLLNLKQARLLQGGEVLALEDGRFVLVEAEPEALMKITAHNPLHLLKLAWHLGNRHLPAMIAQDHILIRQDNVIEDMVRGLGGHIHKIEAPFDPENGAYGGRSASSGGHGHHHHDHD
ncbi:urease accessory protein UreE [Acetobacteraceae bacterium ESL0709]|nr:urease accessory protein UreE [Acetobacteraceae bacterium ESL0697]MDF7677634.1 urease accessory protein UreE [Acetobacteraceae bacterium ESL0709]